jgi:hypothetical protein
MILHAIHADKTFGESGIKGRIIVKSPDTGQRLQETFSNQQSVGLL